MTSEAIRGKPTTRRPAKQEKDPVVGLVFELPEDLGTSRGTVTRITNPIEV